MSPSIAIVGMACRYADARSPAELWENVLAQRRAFRRIPSERLRLADYAPRCAGDPDSTDVTHAALLEGYEFDRVRFRVGTRAFRAADLTHWLALEVAAEALDDAGFRDAEGLPRETTGVIVGNTLTGDRSRADALRLRFPYVRRVAAAGFDEAGLAAAMRVELLDRLETRFKAPFTPPDEETLAGSLSNTIAGRICNHFDLHGGGYTVDGACASSLLSVYTACSALCAGDLDVALAGGVDLSLDPFELVGFARAGALAGDSMRVYDARSAGFWPGEGAGFVALMRYEDALAAGHRIHAVIRGWGVSSDGGGGLTRPELAGHVLALRRAYERAGYGIDTASYFEGHGTGTAVGDATELAAISAARRTAGPTAPPAAIGSIKANIGHTKAAAGVAGVIKATLALKAQIIPPTTGCESPHPELTGAHAALRVIERAEPWPCDRPLRAGVSAMGFGGINAHIALERAPQAESPAIDDSLVAIQDAELFLLGAPTMDALRALSARTCTLAPRISFAELGDLAAVMAQRVSQPAHARAAIVASSPDELAARLSTLLEWIDAGRVEALDSAEGIFLGARAQAPRVGFLFTGQGAPRYRGGGALARRFVSARRLHDQNPLPKASDPASTAVAQVAIVLASLASTSILARLGIHATVAVGHSLGEISALCWAGSIDESALLRIAHARGAAFAEHGLPSGAMAAVRAGAREVEVLLHGTSAVIAGLNAHDQTVVSGDARSVAVVVERARDSGLAAVPLRVSHAFHSPLMAPAAPVLAERLRAEQFQALRGTVVSTVTGAALRPEDDIAALLIEQVTAPVRFAGAVTNAAEDVNLFIEVGPGRALASLASEIARVPAFAVDAGAPSLRGLLSAAGAAFAMGVALHAGELFAGRLVRPFDPERPLRFIASPCEEAEVLGAPSPATSAPMMNSPSAPAELAAETPLAALTRVVMEHTELPHAAVRPDARLLHDLHLSSITVARIVTEVGKRFGLSPSRVPTEYADATLGEVARALDEARSGEAEADPGALQGVGAWVRPFVVDWVQHLVASVAAPPDLTVLALAGDPLGAALRDTLGGAGADGVIVCLPDTLDREAITLLLEGAKRTRDGGRFVLVHRGAGAAFGRTLHLERPSLSIAVVEVAGHDPRTVGHVLAEASTAVRFVEARYDADGARCGPVLRLLADGHDSGELPIDRGDVLLVTGGGKGITAECALRLARAASARLLLLGRSSPADDPELKVNLERFAAAGVEACYAVADVTRAEVVRAAIDEAMTTLGPIAGVVHGAGSNVPVLISGLDEDAFLRTLAVKVQGLHNVLSALDSTRLRALVAFSSVIGRTGMRGEADYAVANEELSRLVERFARQHPACYCRSVEWSVWSGMGMGERLGRIEVLTRRGISPIAHEEGAALLEGLLRTPAAPVTVVVAGRLGFSPTLPMDRPELPLHRFLERPCLYVPGVELIAESVLSVETDPYLSDHELQGERLFPAVMGLEAMAQVAAALARSATPPVFEAVKFTRAVAVPAGERVRIRVAALERGDDRVDVVLRSESTGFAVNHFEAVCRFGAAPQLKGVIDVAAGEHVPLAPEEIYGTILFHRGRFRRLRSYRRLLARACVAQLGPPIDMAWFNGFLPAGLLLGDPGARDACIHAAQACVPHAALLPVSVERIMTCAPSAAPPAVVRALERRHEGDTFVYDIEAADAQGAIVERWTGLTFRVVRGERSPNIWPEALLGPYIERSVRQIVPGSELAVAVHVDPDTTRLARSDYAIRQAAGTAAVIHRRADGKPEITGSTYSHVSVSHAGDLCLAVACARRTGCDMEAITPHASSVWRDLLGDERFQLASFLAREMSEDLDAAATRVWTASESMKKAGAPLTAPLILARTTGGWAVLSSGSLAIVSAVVTARRTARRLALSVLVEDYHACL